MNSNNPLRALISRLVRWAVVEADGGGRGTFPWQQLGYLGQSGRSAAWYPYGFAAVAPAQSPAVLLFVAGHTDSRVHLPGSPQERPTLRPGEVAVYHPDTGALIHFREDGSIAIDAAKDLAVTVDGNASVQVGGTAAISSGGAASVTAPSIALNGNTTVTGNLTVTGDTALASVVTSQGKDISDSHRHPTTDPGSPGNTGVPV